MNPKLLLVVLASLLLVGCGPSKEQLAEQATAQQLGFASVDEMKSLTGRGYKTRSEYDQMLARTPDYCFNDSKYEARCKGQKVDWIGKVTDPGYPTRAEIYFYDNVKKELVPLLSG